MLTLRFSYLKAQRIPSKLNIFGTTWSLAFLDLMFSGLTIFGWSWSFITGRNSQFCESTNVNRLPQVWSIQSHCTNPGGVPSLLPSSLTSMQSCCSLSAAYAVNPKRYKNSLFVPVKRALQGKIVFSPNVVEEKVTNLGKWLFLGRK